MEQLAVGVWLHEVTAEGFPTVSAVVLTGGRPLVVDTSTSPAEMEPVLSLLAEHVPGSRPLVVNTHHHWDHVYGNAAFASEDIVAHASCPRLIEADLRGAGDPAPPAPRAGVPLPSLTFATRLTYSDGCDDIHMIHAPGHTEDSIVVHLEGRGILLAGDTLEWPLPSLGSGSGVEAWLDTIAGLRALRPALIVPSHGPAMGPELIDANESYILELAAAVAAARLAGRTPDEGDLPLARFVVAGAVAGDVSRSAHEANITRLWSTA